MKDRLMAVVLLTKSEGDSDQLSASATWRRQFHMSSYNSSFFLLIMNIDYLKPA